MHAAALVLSLAAVTVDTGYESDGQGGVRYLVHVPPSQIEQLRRSGELVSAIDPRLQGRITEVVVRVTDLPPGRDASLLAATDSQRISPPTLPASSLAGSELPSSAASRVLKPAEANGDGYVLPPGATPPAGGGAFGASNAFPSTYPPTNPLQDPSSSGPVLPPGSSTNVAPSNSGFVGPPMPYSSGAATSGLVLPPREADTPNPSLPSGTPGVGWQATRNERNWQIDSSAAFPSTDPGLANRTSNPAMVLPPSSPLNARPVDVSSPLNNPRTPVRGGFPDTFGQSPSNVGFPSVYPAANGSQIASNPAGQGYNFSPTTAAALPSGIPGQAVAPQRNTYQVSPSDWTSTEMVERSRRVATTDEHDEERAAHGTLGSTKQRGTQPFNQKFLNGLLLLSLVINAYLILVTYKLYLRYRHLIANIRGVTTA